MIGRESSIRHDADELTNVAFDGDLKSLQHSMASVCIFGSATMSSRHLKHASVRQRSISVKPGVALHHQARTVVGIAQ